MGHAPDPPGATGPRLAGRDRRRSLTISRVPFARHAGGRPMVPGGLDAGRFDGPAGLEGRVRRLVGRRRLDADGRAGRSGRGARLRIAVGIRPLPHRPEARRGDHLRVVLDAHRPGHGDPTGTARPHGHLRRVPQPRPHRQVGVHHRRHQRRAVRAGHRRRLEGRRVAGVRLRLPDPGRADGRAGRPPGGHQGHVRFRIGHVRRPLRQRSGGDQRPEGGPAPGSPSSSAATANA